jgi:hypothetical protein
MKKNRAPKNDSPFVRWLLGYVDRHEINLSALSQKAGLSSGSLRSVVNFPNRRPSLETCVRLAEITGKPVQEILELADLGMSQVGENIHPDKSKLIQLYDLLPVVHRRSLVKIAETILEAVKEKVEEDAWQLP